MNMFHKEYTGINDIHGNQVHEGDLVACYPSTKESVLIEEGIYEVLDGQEDPQKVKDTPLYIGTIRYHAPRFMLQMDKPNESGVISCSCWDQYAIEIIEEAKSDE